MLFNDINAKLQTAKQLESIQHPVSKIPLYPNAISHVINAHGRFYGLRSKYDGNGNLRQPMKATLSA
jgi:hypothetical protein